MVLSLYALVRPILFSFDAETMHDLAIKTLSKGWGPKLDVQADPVLKCSAFGLDFVNPVGLAAGFDKQAKAIDGVLALGFGHVEVGTVVPKPQVGNTRPRLFRIPSQEAIINRFGFNSDGLDAVLTRTQNYFRRRSRSDKKVGVNVGKNKDSTELAEDYVTGVTAFAPFADYLTVNISSPNTPGLRDLQLRAPLEDLLTQVIAARDATPKRPPLLVKIAPDQTQHQMEDIADVCLKVGIDGIVIGNTTLTRPQSLPHELAQETGGLSGPPLTDLSTRIVEDMYRLTGGKIPLIGCGGVANGKQAYEKIRAGASLVQIYTSLIYRGPSVVKHICHELAELLKRDGFTKIADAVGAGVSLVPPA